MSMVDSSSIEHEPTRSMPPMSNDSPYPAAPRNSITSPVHGADDGPSNVTASSDQTLTLNVPSHSSEGTRPVSRKPAYQRARAWSDATNLTSYSQSTLVPTTHQLDGSSPQLTPPSQHSIYSRNLPSDTSIPLSAKQPRQLRSTASDADLRAQALSPTSAHRRSRENMDAIHELNGHGASKGDAAKTAAATGKAPKSPKSPKSPKRPKSPKSSKMMSTMGALDTNAEWSMGIYGLEELAGKMVATSPTYKKSGKKHGKHGKARKSSSLNPGQGSGGQPMRPRMQPIRDETANQTLPSSPEMCAADRRSSRASSLASNRRAYITKSIASAEHLIRRESTLTLVQPPPCPEEVPPLPASLASPSLTSNQSSPMSAIAIEEHRPISVITASFLDYEIESVHAVSLADPAGACTTPVSAASALAEVEPPSVALKEDYRAFMDAIGNFRESWLNDDDEEGSCLLYMPPWPLASSELERLEKDRCAALLALLRSEQKFVRMLRLLKDQFITPLRQAAKKPGIYVGRSFSDRDVTAVFGVAEQLLPLHEALLKEFELSKESHGHSGTIEDAINAFSKH
ncbi:hypothetical protein SYNPS1DRAFT_28721, partial [Syncephalis pseudoplumigaleata]